MALKRQNRPRWRLPKLRTFVIVAVVVMAVFTRRQNRATEAPVVPLGSGVRRSGRRILGVVVVPLVVAISYWATLQTLEAVVCSAHLQPDSCHLASELPTYAVALFFCCYVLGGWALGWMMWPGANEEGGLPRWAVALMLAGSAAAVHLAVFGHMFAPHTADAARVMHSLAATAATWIASACVGILAAFTAKFLILRAAAIPEIPALVRSRLQRLRSR